MAVKNTTIQKKNIHPPKKGIIWIFIISLFFAELLVYTCIRIESTHTVIRISQVHKEYAKALAYHKSLVVERDRLKSDERITRIARTRLNLSSPAAQQIIYLAGGEQ